MGKAMRAGMPADRGEVRGRLTVLAVDEATCVVGVLVVHLEVAGHARRPGSAGALAGRVAHDVIGWEFPHGGLGRQG